MMTLNHVGHAWGTVRTFGSEHEEYARYSTGQELHGRNPTDTMMGLDCTFCIAHFIKFVASGHDSPRLHNKLTDLADMYY